MKWQIANFVEPSRVRMMWQSTSEETRTRFHVGDLIRAGGSVALFYAFNSPEFWQAIQAGFQGYPAFGISHPVHHQNVIEIFSRRLPPRNRSDFNLFLLKHGLARKPEISELALIGYTGARLPADGFSFEIDFSLEVLPFEFQFEVSGFRYYDGMNLDVVSLVDQPVMLSSEPTNVHDPQAVQIFVGQTMIGYVPKSYAAWLATTFTYARVLGVISRIEGPLSRPQVYVYLSLARTSTQAFDRQRLNF